MRFWDLTTLAQCDVAGPTAKESRGLAFVAKGGGAGAQALLAACPDGLRALSWEPSQPLDFVELPWPKVSRLCYFCCCSTCVC